MNILRLVPVCLLFAGLFPVVSEARLLFEENFDNQPDWTSASKSTERSQYARHGIPDGWYAVRQDPTWAPSVGHADRHESIEILSANADKARGGRGKSFVSWRDSYDPGSNRWNSESMMVHVLEEQHDELYVEFWIRFDPNWTKGNDGGTSKLFRLFSWNGQESIFSFFGDGNSGPIFLWDYKDTSSYGIRNRLAFRGGPWGKNYSMSNADLGGDSPRSIVSGSQGDVDMNFLEHSRGMGEGGGYPKLVDRVNGGLLSRNPDQIVRHEQLFGDEANGPQWTKIGFYVRMNSAPGRNDGWLMQWINDVQTLNIRTINWVKGGGPMVGWNAIAIGGNDYFNSYPNSARREEWYSIDDLRIYDSLPADGDRPMPPKLIGAE